MKLNTKINLEKNDDIKKDIRKKINKINCEQKKRYIKHYFRNFNK